MAELPLVRRAARFLDRSALENRANDANVSSRELVHPAVARPIRGERMRREPVATRELVEIGAGVDAAIEVVDAETFRLRCQTRAKQRKAQCTKPNARCPTNAILALGLGH